jgi:hypothetical protein
VVTDLAEPRVERGLAAEAVELLDRTAERLLDDIASLVLVAREVRERVAVQAREETRRTALGRHPGRRPGSV